MDIQEVDALIECGEGAFSKSCERIIGSRPHAQEGTVFKELMDCDAIGVGRPQYAIRIVSRILWTALTSGVAD
ncbi:MAG: hypothetical protein AB7G08_33550 [Hyphomicrobiaceae bacterium]